MKKKRRKSEKIRSDAVFREGMTVPGTDLTFLKLLHPRVISGNGANYKCLLQCKKCGHTFTRWRGAYSSSPEVNKKKKSCPMCKKKDLELFYKELLHKYKSGNKIGIYTIRESKLHKGKHKTSSWMEFILECPEGHTVEYKKFLNLLHQITGKRCTRCLNIIEGDPHETYTKEARNNRIVSLFKAGKSIGAIARFFGMTRQGAYNIINKKERKK